MLRQVTSFYLVFIFLLLSQLVQLDFLQDFNHVTTFSPIQARIMNGTEAEEGRWPFMASLQVIPDGYNEYAHFCGGTILNDDTILSNLWCFLDFDKATETIVVIGQVNKTNPDPKNVYNVTKFIHGTNDVAVVKLARKIDFSDTNVSKVCLPSPDDEPVVDQCIAMGWGWTWGVGHPKNQIGDSPDILRQVDLPIRTVDECPNGGGLYDDKFFYCAGFYDGSKTACVGDGGGPLMCPSKSDTNVYLQFGISSFMEINCLSFSFFAKTVPSLDWIKQQAEAPCPRFL